MNLVGMLRTLFLSPNLAYLWCIETDPYSGKNQSVARRGGQTHAREILQLQGRRERLRRTNLLRHDLRSIGFLC